MMSRPQLQTGYLILEGLNSFSSVYYLYYLYFFMRTVFGFGNEANLALACLNGFVCMTGSFCAGHFAQRFGYFFSLKLGFIISIAALGAGTQVVTAAGQIAVMIFMVLGVCFTWPPLEALVSDGETRGKLPRMLGLYNMVWAATAALANFTGGAMIDNLGLRSLFWVPLGILIVQVAITGFLQKKAGQLDCGQEIAESNPACAPNERNHRGSAETDETRRFLRMAWFANPFAYIAINTLVAVIPGMAKKFELSTMAAGFCCSVWLFARLSAFWVLWHWNGWHYRFRWMLVAYLSLIFTFAALILAPNLAVLVLAQIIFGCAAGLIYYSSLFYSMERTENRGKQGGIHEAAIGLGNFVGPAVGAGSIHFFPQYTSSAAIAVSAVLLMGLSGLLAIQFRSKVQPDSQKKIELLEKF